MIKQKKIPLRKCIVTNEQFPKMEMFRIVRTPEGSVVVDLTGKVRGHGAYVSKNKTAIETARKKKIFDRHLEVQVPNEIYDELLAIIEGENK